MQVVWLKQSVAGEQLSGTFPERTEPMRTALGAVVDLLAARCPNLKLVLASSRLWTPVAGRMTFAYETAFAVKGLIEDRAALPPGTAPWVGWGPYLWADGSTPRADGLTWELWDLEGDSIHPGPTAEWTVAQALEPYLAAPLLRAKLSFLVDAESGPRPVDVFTVASEAWDEASISWNGAPATVPPALATGAQGARDFARGRGAHRQALPPRRGSR